MDVLEEEVKEFLPSITIRLRRTTEIPSTIWVITRLFGEGEDELR
jgi:hypothetical protein